MDRLRDGQMYRGKKCFKNCIICNYQFRVKNTEFSAEDKVKGAESKEWMDLVLKFLILEMKTMEHLPN